MPSHEASQFHQDQWCIDSGCIAARNFGRSPGGPCRNGGLARLTDITTHVEVLRNPRTDSRLAPTALITPTPSEDALKRMNRQAPRRNSANETGRARHCLRRIPCRRSTAVMTLTSRVSTRDCATDFAASGEVGEGQPRQDQRFLRFPPSSCRPTDRQINSPGNHHGRNHRRGQTPRHLRMDHQRPSATPRPAGCGRGDIRFMLESKTSAANART